MIVHVIMSFSARGGAEAMLARLINADPRSRVILIALMSVSDELRATITNPHAEIISYRARGPAGLLSAIRSLARDLRRLQPAALVCWLYHAAAFGALAALLSGYRGRVVWNVRGALDDPRSVSKSVWGAIAICLPLLGRCDALVFNSETGRRNHARFGFRKAGSRVIPNGLALPPRLEPTARRPRVIGTAGRLHVDKDYPTLLGAIRRVLERKPDAEILIAGRDATLANPEFRGLIEAAGIDASRLQTFGELADMTSFYPQLDVFVMPSRTEGFPNVVLEAMAHGLPCAVTDVGDAAMLVGQTGEVVLPQDSNALAAAVLRLMDLAPENYRVRALAARARVEARFNIARIALEYDSFFMGDS